jgi:hypothetical protein
MLLLDVMLHEWDGAGNIIDDSGISNPIEEVG